MNEPAKKARSVTLCVTGSVAAYKAAIVARLLVTRGIRVRPVLTRGGERFLGGVTLSGITGEATLSDMWDPSFAGEMHVALSDEVDAVAIVPATADVLARLASGRADDLVTALALCAKGPVICAPAMHPRMWEHPATQANVKKLAEQGRVRLVGPVFGRVASGDEGLGRMTEPEEIARAIEASFEARDLEGVRLVVTAGPTFEDLDPVRFIGNRSTGKMGFAIAERAALRGAQVTLISGPVTLSTPFGVRRVDVRSADEMRSALAQTLGEGLNGADALVMAAAVGDFRPSEKHERKLKKEGAPPSIALAENPDLLAEIGAKRTGRGPLLVGFALETGTDPEVIAYARKKLAAKKVDFVVANAANESLGRDDNRAFFVSRSAEESLSRMSKIALADEILTKVKIGVAFSP